MKIGLVCPYNMFQFAGGVQEIVFQLERDLSERGHEVRIITPRPRAHVDDPPHNMILVGRSAKVNTPFATMVDFGFEADGDEIDTILEREQFDVLHFHEPWVPMLSRQILQRSKAINVATFHAKSPESVVSKSIITGFRPYMKSVVGYIHVFTAVSDAATHFIKDFTDEPIHIVPNGIDLSRFSISKHYAASKKKTILYLGRLEKRKGVEYLLQAYDQLRLAHDDVRLVIAGSGVKRKTLERLVDEYEIPDVTFMGYVDEADKPRLMAEADLYVSPALYGESFGIVLLEAMAVGTPVVAGNNTGYASVMTGRGRLSLVSPKSTDDFAQRLELMLYDNELRRLWLAWAHQHVQQFQFSNITDAYEVIYDKALQRV